MFVSVKSGSVLLRQFEINALSLIVEITDGNDCSEERSVIEEFAYIIYGFSEELGKTNLSLMFTI